MDSTRQTQLRGDGVGDNGYGVSENSDSDDQ